MMKHIYSLFSLLLICFQLAHAQYTETFDVANKGIMAGPCTTNDPTSCASYDFSGVNWTLEGNLSGLIAVDDNFYTVGGVLRTLDLDEEICWVSPVLNMTGTASFTMDLTWVGFDDYNASAVGSKDYIDVAYRIDGGSWVTLPNAVGGGPRTVSYIGSTGNDGSLTNFGASGLTGSILQIRVCVDANASAEIVTIDNVAAVNADVGAGPVCDLQITGSSLSNESCIGANDGSVSYTTSTSNGPVSYTLTGLSVNINNQTGVFNNLAPGNYTLTIQDGSFASGDCTINQNVTIVPATNACCPTYTNNIAYVKHDATGANNGTSWADAFTDLQDALNSSCPGINEIWVAAGTYYPTSGTDRNVSFVMKNNLSIYGGFNGTETLLSQRNLFTNPTILSGDIGTAGNSGDNSYNVIKNNNNALNNTAVLDGFTITGGNANGGSEPTGYGGGMYNNNVSPRIINCKFENNYSTVNGGAIFIKSGAPIITNSIFINNTTLQVGGAIRFTGAGMLGQIFNCSFYGNTAGNPTTGCIAVSGGTIEISNSILYGNPNGNIFGGAVVTHSIVQGGFSGTGNLNSDPMFVNAAAGDLRLQACSPAINAGSNASVPVGIITDLDGNPRFYNSGTVDMGAYEFQGAKNENPTNGGEISADQNICFNEVPALIENVVLPSGHTGTLEYQWQSSTSDPADPGFDPLSWMDILASNSSSYQPAALTQTTWYRRLARVDCSTDWSGAAESNVIEITIELTPISGTLAKTPDEGSVCEGTDVSASLSSGSGGNGIDELEYRTHDGISWSGWIAYVSGNSVSTAGLTEVEIRTRRTADFCSDADYITANWKVEQTLVPGTLVKTPDVAVVCEGTPVSAELIAAAKSMQSQAPIVLDLPAVKHTETSADMAVKGNGIQIIPAMNPGNQTRSGMGNVLFDNGPFVNGPGQGPDGSDYSILQNSSLSMSALGFGFQKLNGNRIADDFVVDAFWSANQLKLFTYQTNSPTTSTITGAYVQIWDGHPAAGGSVIWGDLTTNRMISTSFTNIYRVSETNVNTARPIMEVVCSLENVLLGPGTYWIDVMVDGSLGSGPWAVPVTIAGQATTGNGIQFLGSWGNLLDTNSGAQQGLSFVIEGNTSGTDELEYRTNNGSWSVWQDYVSEDPVPTDGLTAIEIRTRKLGIFCANSDYNTVSWTVDPQTVAGSISGTTEIVYGSSTGDLTLSGHTGTVVIWQRRFGTDGTWEDIANTTALLNEIPTSVGTWFYRAEVQSGVCDPAFTDAHEILVTTKELSIGGTFTAADKVYDGTTFASFYANNLTLTGIVGTDDVSLTGETIVFADPDVADGIEVNITAANLAGAAAGNYSLSLVGSPATNANIIPKDITVINSIADNKVYDGTTAATISGATLGGVVGSDEVYFTSLTGTFAQSNAGENLAVEAALIIGGAQAGNYQLIQPTGLTATIFKAVLTVTAQNASKQYGEANPPLQFAFSNWVAGPEEINIEPQLTTTVDESTPAGFYPGSIEAFGAFDNNYTFTYIAADFTVGASPLLVIADDKDRPYGSANPVFTASYVGLKNGETAPATLPVLATTATAASPTGTYPITATGAADPNYSISYQEGTLTITKAPLTIMADAQSKTYDGLVFPAEQFSVQYEGFVLGENPEVLSGSLTYGTQATTAVNVGTYTIDPSGYSSDNYALSYQTATLEINKAPLVITADDQIMCQGQELPELSLSYAGFVNGESSAVLDEQPYGQTYASPASDPGTYAINIWGGSDNNYTLYRQPGELTILAQPTAAAGNDASICASQSYTLSQATAEGATHISWTSSGDGSFDDPAALNPTYTPGVQDQNNGTVVLTITASTQGVCQASSTMTLSIQQQVVPTVTITSSQNSVCSGTLVGFVAQATHQGTSPVYQWKVNGLPVGGNNASYSYVPQQGDVVTVALSSSEACANPAMVTSNAIEMQVTQSLLTLNTFPENGGMVSMTGEVQIGSLVNLQAQANQGWGFVHWKNAQGTIVSTQASFQYQIQSCGEVLTAYFESLTTLAGQLRYFNALESPMPAGEEGSPFIMQLYQDGNPIGQPQQAGNLYNGMPSTFEFTGLEASENYTIRLWESPNEDVLSNTWMWNSWGGVTALDALIINMRSTESNTLTAFPWILPEMGGTFSPLFTGVADVNQSNSVTALDALIATQRVSGQTEQFPSGRHNFLIAGAATQSMQAGVFPSAPETIFTSYGSYDPAAPATAHYYEATTAALQVGTNYMQLYFVAAGDMNASYLPGTQQKQTIDLHYEGKILAENGSEITIPVAVDAGVHLGALTLEITFDHTALQVAGIEGIDIYNINNEEGSIKIAWSDVQGKMLQAGDAVFTIQAQLKKDISDDYRYMEFTGITELADVQAKLIHDVGLKTSYIGKTSQTGQKLTHQVRPNPFSETAAIQFVLPEEGVVSLRIFDQYGQLVKQYQSSHFPAGSNEYKLYSADLHRSGTYYYMLEFESDSNTENHVGTIVLIK